MTKSFIIIGSSGYIAPRHIKAIKDTQNELLACLDISSNFEMVLSSFPNCICYSSFEEFNYFVTNANKKIDFLVICSPNYLHFDHCAWGLRQGIDVICEKPVTLDYDHLGILRGLEIENNARLFSILQLRLHDTINDLRKYVLQKKKDFFIDLTYITPRSEDYLKTWKGDSNKSGGILFNIGLHFFDMLVFIFGEPNFIETHYKDQHVLSGYLKFNSAHVSWFLSVKEEHSPNYMKEQSNLTFRSITIDNQKLDFSSGFDDLHTKSYLNIFQGKGCRIEDNEPVMRLLKNIEQSTVASPSSFPHPFFKKL